MLFCTCMQLKLLTAALNAECHFNRAWRSLHCTLRLTHLKYLVFNNPFDLNKRQTWITDTFFDLHMSLIQITPVVKIYNISNAVKMKNECPLKKRKCPLKLKIFEVMAVVSFIKKEMLTNKKCWQKVGIWEGGRLSTTFG